MAAKTFSRTGGFLKFIEVGVVLKYYNLNELQIEVSGDEVQFPDGNSYAYNDPELTNVFASAEAFADQVGTWKREAQGSGGGGGTDPNAVHVNVAAEISAITEKTSIDQQDEFIIEDSEDSFNKKSITRKTLLDPVVNSQASTATLTIDSNETELAILTAQNGSCTIAAPTGSPAQGQKLLIRINDNGSAAPLTWNAIFQEIGVTLPTTTTANKTLYIGCIYNTDSIKWDVIAVKEQA